MPRFLSILQTSNRHNQHIVVTAVGVVAYCGKDHHK